MYHGEEVAFGALTGLQFTDAPPHEQNTVYSFCEEVGLPTTLADLGLGRAERPDLLKVAERACAPAATPNKRPFRFDRGSPTPCVGPVIPQSCEPRSGQGVGSGRTGHAEVGGKPERERGERAGQPPDHPERQHADHHTGGDRTPSRSGSVHRLPSSRGGAYLGPSTPHAPLNGETS